MADLIILNEEQLRKLATVIYYREVTAIKNIQFGSEQERVKYLRDCRINHESIMGLLDAGVRLRGGFQDDEIKDPIAHDIFSYVKICVNSALQMVRNYTLRMNYLKKIKEQSNFLMDALRKLDPKSLENAKGLAMEAVQHKNAMLEYTKKHQSGPSRVFSKWVKEKGWTFEELVKRYQTKIGYGGPFKNLKEVEKLQVYEEIIEASGRGRALANRLWTELGVVGIAVLLFTAGIMVWDLYSSEQKLETATRNTVQIASAVGGAMLGKVVAAALVPKLVGVVAPSFFVGMMGIILGIAGAFILGAFTGWLVDLIFGSGSDQAFSTDGHHCYVAPMPDGKVLARRIAHQDSMAG